MKTKINWYAWIRLFLLSLVISELLVMSGFPTVFNISVAFLLAAFYPENVVETIPEGAKDEQ